LIDTGFSGALCLPRSLASGFNLTKIFEEEIYGIGLHKEIVDVAITTIIWFGKKIEIEVLINDGDDRLLGSELLDGNVLTVNYEKRTLTIKPARQN
jgi:clan AA aspartic protease